MVDSSCLSTLHISAMNTEVMTSGLASILILHEPHLDHLTVLNTLLVMSPIHGSFLRNSSRHITNSGSSMAPLNRIYMSLVGRGFVVG